MIQSEFVIAPNASLERRTNIMFFLGISAVILVIAVGLTLMGFWMVLPFAGLELTALGAALLMVDYKNQYREVVRVSEQTVSIASGHKGPQKSYEFNRRWTSVLLQAGVSDNHPEKLLLRSRGRQIEVGACLVPEERSDLWRTLKKLIEQP